jgi:hypothetical protein
VIQRHARDVYRRKFAAVAGEHPRHLAVTRHLVAAQAGPARLALLVEEEALASTNAEALTTSEREANPR